MVVYFLPQIIAIMGQILYDKRLVKVKGKQLYSLLMIFTMTLVVGLRASTVGRDTANYCDFFDFFQNGGKIFEYPLQDFEPGFQIYTKICAALLPNSGYYLLVTAAITFYLFNKNLINKSSYPPLSFIIFNGMFFVYTFNLLREFLAIAISLKAIEFINKKNWVNTAIIIGVAMSIHTSAILTVAYALLGFPKLKKVLKWAIAGQLIAILLKNNVFNTIAVVFPQYTNYVIHNAIFASEGSLSSWFKVGIYVALCGAMIITAKYTKEEKKNLKYRNALQMSFAATLSIYGNTMVMFHRLVYYFGISICNTVPELLKALVPKWRWLAIVTIEGLMAVMLYLSIRAGNNVATAYQSWV